VDRELTRDQTALSSLRGELDDLKRGDSKFQKDRDEKTKTKAKIALEQAQVEKKLGGVSTKLNQQVNCPECKIFDASERG
jgi:hypothetical protein